MCSSDDSDEDVLEEDRVRIVPIWRSEVGTRLAELADIAYTNMRNTETPKRPGRKPAKRVRSTDQPTPGCSRWPNGLPSDCYREGWIRDVGPKTAVNLEMKQPMLQGVVSLQLAG